MTQLHTRDSPAAAPAPMLRRSLSFCGPLAWRPLAAALAAHAVPGLERVAVSPDGATVERMVSVSAGPGLPVRVPIRVSLGETPEGISRVVLELPVLDPALESGVTALVRSWLDLDADPAVIDSFLSGSTLLAPLVRRHPGLRVPGSTDGFETAVQTVLGQQVSLAAARTFGARLAAAFGEPGPAGLTAFPAADSLAGVPASDIQSAVRITHFRARTLAALADAVASGLDLSPEADPVKTRAALLELPGIGPWTADYLAVRVLGDRDAWPAGDLVLKRALGVAGERQATELSRPWRPWRAYALFHLWTAAAYLPDDVPDTGPIG